MVTPDYYERFRCIGGECKNNCCRGGWEIEVDDAAFSRFMRLDGEFGDRVRSAMNEEHIFKQENGECPLLTKDGWCDMACHGEELCIVCDEYPRFTEFWEEYSERGISVSCEAAADIILNNQDKVQLCGESEPCNEPIFRLIYNARGRVFSLLQNRELDIFTRLSLAMDYTAQLQEQINIDDYETEPDYECFDRRESAVSLAGYAEFISGLEVLDPLWRDMLKKLIAAEKEGQTHAADALKTEQLAVYFVYRYYLRGAFDCDVLSKFKLAVLSIMTIVAMDNIYNDFAECARLYSIEIEHDEDNIEAIYDEFLFGDKFSYENILDMLQ